MKKLLNKNLLNKTIDKNIDKNIGKSNTLKSYLPNENILTSYS
jgi:hypothetical protein